MTTKRNIILALIFVMGTASALYAEKPNRRDNRNDPRGKNKPAMKDKRNVQPKARAEKPAKRDAGRNVAKRPNDKRFIERRPAKIRPVAKPQPRKEVKVVKVVQPRPREVVKVINVYQNVTPYCEYNDKEVFYVTILNRTGRSLDLELDGSHEGDDDIGKLYPGEGMRYPLVVKSKKLPETFELEAGPFELDFTLTRCSPRDLVFIVTPSGIYAE